MKKGSDPSVKARRDPQCKKIVLSMFVDFKGPLTIDFLEPKTMVNADRYQQTLTKLKADIQNKRRTEPRPRILHRDNKRFLHTQLRRPKK